MRTVNKKSFALTPDALSTGVFGTDASGADTSGVDSFNAIDGRLALDSIINMPGALLRRAQQSCSALFAEEVGDAELTSVQYAALAAIRDYPGIDATTLSGLVFADRATIGGVLGRLIAKGLVERRESLADRRVKELDITPAGGTLLTEIEGAVLRVQQRLLAPLTAPEKKLFLSLLRRLIAGDSAPASAPRDLRTSAAALRTTGAAALRTTGAAALKVPVCKKK